METSVDISDLPRPALIGIGAGILVLIVILFFMVDRFVYPILPRPALVEVVPPPPGYPDRPPYNVKGWQENVYKKQQQGQPAGGRPMMPPPGPPR